MFSMYKSLYLYYSDTVLNNTKYKSTLTHIVATLYYYWAQEFHNYILRLLIQDYTATHTILL